jgi:hypothetical protein
MVRVETVTQGGKPKMSHLGRGEDGALERLRPACFRQQGMSDEEMNVGKSNDMQKVELEVVSAEKVTPTRCCDLR